MGSNHCFNCNGGNHNNNYNWITKKCIPSFNQNCHHMESLNKSGGTISKSIEHQGRLDEKYMNKLALEENKFPEHKGLKTSLNCILQQPV